MYLESHMDFAAAPACWKAADGILHSLDPWFLNVERMNGDHVDLYLARRLFSAACHCSKYMAGFSERAP